MSCKSAIYTAMTTATTLTAGATIPLGSTVRRFGQALRLNNNAIVLRDIGYYKADVSVTLTPTTAGNVTVTLYNNGVAIPGAIATATTAETTDVVTLNIPAIIRTTCENQTGSLTLVVSAASSVANVGMVVDKL